MAVQVRGEKLSCTSCTLPHHPSSKPPAHSWPLPLPPQEVKALLGERRGLQVSLQAAQREAAGLAGELAEARRGLAAAWLQAEQEQQRRAQVEQAWAATKEVRGAGSCVFRVG